MPTISDGRRRLALLSLALGGFAVGATEFVVMGLLPNIARSLLPQEWGSDPDASIAHAGSLVTAYALGVVVGAPTIAATTARVPRRKLLLILLVGFTVATVASAVLPSFGPVLAARFIAGLPHGAYFAVASMVAANLMGPGNRGRGIAMVLSGLMLANVIGVPLITWVGQTAGWRTAYLLVAALFALTVAAVLVCVPSQTVDPGGSLRRELRAFSVAQVWLTIGIGAIGFGGYFAVYSYIAPLVTTVTALPESRVPVVLIVLGIGMSLGNQIGGRLADRSVKLSLYAGMTALMLTLLAVATLSGSAIGLYTSALLVGTASATLSPTVQSRLMDVAKDSPNIAAALSHSALNVGNSIGASLGGAAIAAGYGYRAPATLGIGLALIGLILTATSYALEHRHNSSRPHQDEEEHHVTHATPNECDDHPGRRPGRPRRAIRRPPHSPQPLVPRGILSRDGLRRN